MCGSTKAPQVVQQDPVADAKAAAATAANDSNSALSARRRKLRENSLITTGAAGTSTGSTTRGQRAASTILGVAYGKDTLGSGSGTSVGSA